MNQKIRTFDYSLERPLTNRCPKCRSFPKDHQEITIGTRLGQECNLCHSTWPLKVPKALGISVADGVKVDESVGQAQEEKPPALGINPSEDLEIKDVGQEETEKED